MRLRADYILLVLFCSVMSFGSCTCDGEDPVDAGDVDVADGGDEDSTVDETGVDTEVADTDATDVRDSTVGDADAAADGEVDGGGTGLPTVQNPSADQCGAPADATLEHAAVAEGHCAWVFADGLSGARGIEVDSSGHVIVVARRDDDLVTLHDDNGNGVIETGERSLLVENGPGLNHGLWLHDGYLYASSATTVYRWPYTPGTTSELANRETVVQNIPGGGHATRTLVARPGSDWLYVNIGSAGNVTDNANRALVRRYDLSSIPNGGYQASAGEIWANGLRNEVALAFDDSGRLWGMQNGMDNLMRSDIGGDIHADNPGEELNLLDDKGDHHGYPYCWSEYDLPDQYAMGPGTQWVTPQFQGDGTHSDAWCRDTNNVEPPELVLLGHQAPLGLLFYDASGLDARIQGDALAALHGSWNRPTPAGYKVVRLVFDESGEPVRSDPFLEFAGSGDDGPDWAHRFVEPAVASDGTLLVTSDASSVVVAISKKN